MRSNAGLMLTERVKMTVNSNDFQVKEGEQVTLKKWPTLVKPVYKSKKSYNKLLAEQVAELSDLQQLLYASNRYSLLLIFQAMDTAGKDGAIRHVMSGINPQGCQVFSFKHPSATELDHDFLWRTTQCLPERGRIGIFNRSYYEEVLIVRVHPEILHGQGLPDGLHDEKTIWQERYRSIVDLESHLYRNGTRIIKFFLHISEEEQRKRFLDRIDEPEKTGNSALPTFDKENARLIISRIILDTFKALKMSYPEADEKRRQELLSIRHRLMDEGSSSNRAR